MTVRPPVDFYSQRFLIWLSTFPYFWELSMFGLLSSWFESEPHSPEALGDDDRDRLHKFIYT